MQVEEREHAQRQIDEAQYGRGLLFIKVDDIRPNPRNPRKAISQTALNALADSIKQHGQLQPVVVRKVDDEYELIAGERRWRACQRAQIERVWAVERHVRGEFEAAALAFVENAQRVDLSREEKIAALDDLGELVGSVGLRRLAAEIKVAPSWLSEQLKVRRDPDIFPALEEGQISVAQAAALARAPAHARRTLLDRTTREHPEYRVVRAWVDEVRHAEKQARARIAAVATSGNPVGPEGTATVSVTESSFVDVLVALRAAGELRSTSDRRAAEEIRHHCDRLLAEATAPITLDIEQQPPTRGRRTGAA
jgi:ParB/RepB/Spo0J family partition protein